MRYVNLLVEQLDRAARELATDHAINNRIALILVDNAVELIVHHRLEFHVDFRERLLQKLSPKQRLMARGQHLGDRLKVLRHLNDLSDKEQEFIRLAHNYRGELYHAGLRHNAIIRAITFRYYHLVCELFVRLPRGFRTHYANETFTATLAKYIGPSDRRILDAQDKDIAARLLAELPAETPSLQPVLAKAARAALERMQEGLNFLVEEIPKISLLEILAMAQRQFDFDQALARDGVDGTCMTPGYNETVNEVHAEMSATWRPQHRQVPLAMWSSRADAIEKERDDLRALSLYHALRGDMAYLEEAIGEYAAGLDRHIQMEIDRMRGK